MKKVNIGDSVYVVPTVGWLGKPFIASVTKVGRTWAHLSSGHRMDLKTWRLDGGRKYLSLGDCYQSEEAYQQVTLRAAVVRDFQKKISSGAFIKASVEQIRQAAEILEIGLEV